MVVNLYTVIRSSKMMKKFISLPSFNVVNTTLSEHYACSLMLHLNKNCC
jgi:hypothetical protein